MRLALGPGSWGPSLLVLAAALATAAPEESAPATLPSATTPGVTATASKSEVTVGEPFTVEVKTTGPAGVSWTFPAETGDDKVELRTAAHDSEVSREREGTPGFTPGAPEAAAVAGNHRYDAAAFALGEAQVPAIEVQYRLPDGTMGTVSTSPVPLRILSVLPKDSKDQKLADIRGPVGVAIGPAFWVMAGVLALTLAALLAWVLRRRRGPAAAKPAVPDLPPDALAFAAILRLAESGLLSRGEYRAFYIELTAIAKTYLEARLGAPVREMTSSEAVAFLRESTAAHELAPALRDLALAADRIKFARGGGLVEEAERHLAAVRAMVAALEERLRPRPIEAPEKVA